MQLQYSIQVWRKGNWYVAKCPEMDFISQGRTRDEAKANLLEVLEIQLQEMTEMGTLEEYLKECGYAINQEIATFQPELIGFEKLCMQVNACPS